MAAPERGAAIRKEGQHMHYVIQVSPGTESKTEAQIREIVPADLYSACFHPVRLMRKKIHGQWKEVREKLLPGYVFIVSDDIKNLCIGLSMVPALTKLLGREEADQENFTALSDSDVEWLERMVAPAGSGRGPADYEVGLSQVAVMENAEVKIISGPLENIEGVVKKINLHKRMAEVEVEFMNRRTIIHLGIELVERKNDS